MITQLFPNILWKIEFLHEMTKVSLPFWLRAKYMPAMFLDGTIHSKTCLGMCPWYCLHTVCTPIWVHKCDQEQFWVSNIMHLLRCIWPFVMAKKHSSHPQKYNVCFLVNSGSLRTNPRSKISSFLSVALCSICTSSLISSWAWAYISGMWCPDRYSCIGRKNSIKMAGLFFHKILEQVLPTILENCLTRSHTSKKVLHVFSQTCDVVM